MANAKLVTSKFEEHQLLINNFQREENNHFNNTNSLIINGFDALTSFNKNLIDQDYNQNFVIMETLKQIAIKKLRMALSI
jgi:hypothetical protein